jgi:hypothetical protein
VNDQEERIKDEAPRCQHLLCTHYGARSS